MVAMALKTIFKINLQYYDFSLSSLRNATAINNFMAKIVNFPKKVDEREAALTRLAHRILVHLVVRFYDRGILDVPIQIFVKDMTNNLMRDGHEYNAALLDTLGQDQVTLERIERMFIRALIERGHITG